MDKEIPLFPLNLVVFPGEELNLHIFEPRYKQLVNDCLQTKTNFGIPSYVMTRIDMGTEVKIVEVTKLYEDGRMDIKTKGVSVFEVIDFQNPWSNREYAGGLVRSREDLEPEDPSLNLKIAELIAELLDWLQSDDQIEVQHDTVLYKFVHKIGLKLEEEYELLKMNSGVKRQEYIIKHLETLIPALERAEKAREKIRMNGHFKHLDPLKF